jgi:hypothetical protein
MPRSMNPQPLQQYGIITGGKARTFLVSQQAYDGLEEMCKRWHVGKRRMGALLAFLPAEPTKYVDRRPQEWKDQDVAMLEADQWPLWSYEYGRLHRTIRVSDATIDKLVNVARYHSITMPYHKTNWDYPMSRMNALLEALGTGLLDVHVDR